MIFMCGETSLFLDYHNENLKIGDKYEQKINCAEK